MENGSDSVAESLRSVGRSDTASGQKGAKYWISRFRGLESTEQVEMRPDSEAWMGQDLHLFIITDAGKPVYSRYGTVQRLSPILCTCVAILGHLEARSEELNHFRAGDHTFVFLPKQPFIFIAVSRTGLPVSYLFKQLNFLYTLFLSLFSESLIAQLSLRPSCDFRQIAEGVKPAWDGVVNNMSDDPAFVFAPAIPVASRRADLTKLLESLPPCKLSIAMHRNRIIAIGSRNIDSLSARLIVDLVWTPAFEKGVAWIPFFGRDGTNVHQLYINKDKNSELCITCLCSEVSQEVHDRTMVLLGKKHDSPGPKIGAVDVFYFWAAHSVTYGQVFATDPDSSMDNSKMKEIVGQLVKACDMTWMNGVDGEYMFRGDKEVAVAWKSRELEIYGICKNEDMPDEAITRKMGVLRAFVHDHFAELFITDHRFHFE
jgi:hypothetical protein